MNLSNTVQVKLQVGFIYIAAFVGMLDVFLLLGPRLHLNLPEGLPMVVSVMFAFVMFGLFLFMRKWVQDRPENSNRLKPLEVGTVIGIAVVMGTVMGLTNLSRPKPVLHRPLLHVVAPQN